MSTFESLVQQVWRHDVESADRRAEEERRRRELLAATLRSTNVLNMDQLLVKHFGVDTPKELDIFRSPPKPQSPVTTSTKESSDGKPPTVTRFPPPPRRP